MKLQHIILTGLVFVSTITNAQNKITADFSEEAWEIEAKNHEFVEYKGKKSLYLDNGKVRLKNSSFRNGIIEYDINFEKGRKFAGVHFRIQDVMNYEEYYLRAHQSGNDDSMQYTPVINGNAGWQLYSGEGYWSQFNYRFGEWMHVKLIVSGDKMDVFIDDMEKPILHVRELKLGSTTGSLGFGTFLGAAYYANLTYQEIEKPELATEEKTFVENKLGTILDWKVSEAFSETKLNDITSLKELQISIAKELKVDSEGILNLSYISEVSDATNTVLAKFNIDSEKEQLKRIDFGYSDKVIVFVNGKPVYFGDNSFRTRDYRYLGSIGYFDSVYLDLKKGKNEIVFAVTEKMGGWGLMARISN